MGLCGEARCLKTPAGGLARSARISVVTLQNVGVRKAMPEDFD